MIDLKSGFRNTPPVVKNLIIINVLFLLASFTINTVFNGRLEHTLGLFFFKSEQFHPYQIVTHMFMHGGIGHLFFNMFALWMFGRVLETVWGPKRFFIYYFVTGLGAILVHTAVNYIHYLSIVNNLSPELVQIVIEKGHDALLNYQNFTNPEMAKLNIILNTPTIGASGAVFGVLLAFGMLFPNTELMLLFPPIPIKAKYFVIIYGVLELVLGLSQQGSNIAHFAHLGGMLFGYILIKYWNSKKNTFY